MALLENIILFTGVLIIAVANAEFVTFDGNCPDLSPPDDLEIDFMGKYYTIAETGNGTSKTNIVNQFMNVSSTKFLNVELFRTAESTEGECEQAVVLHSYVKPGIYQIEYQDGQSTHFEGDYIYFLSNLVALVCRNSMDNETYEAEVSVLSMDSDKEFDSDLQTNVEDVLKSYDLEYLNEYFSPIKQDNKCEES